MKRLILPLPGNQVLAEQLAQALQAELGVLDYRRFPDGESYLRLLCEVKDQEVVLVCSLDRPDDKLASLLFAARLVREYGARRIGLVAPYLAYMRQDARFNPGEGIMAGYFADLLSPQLDWLVTVDPHLHRINDLSEIYRCQSRVVHAAEALAGWVKLHIASPILIGPDGESEQWVSEVAALAGAPFTVLQKVRRGDREVEVSLPEPGLLQGRTPVLVDDIISTAHTMAQTLGHLAKAGAAPAICIGVHGLFAGDALALLQRAGAAEVISCDTVCHDTNRIELAPWLVQAILSLA